MKQVHGIWLPDADTHFSDHLAREIEAYGVPGYQTAKWQGALPSVKRRRCAVDVGAHVGLWSIKMAMTFETVVAFEPVPELQACFAENLKAFPNVRLEPFALGAVVATVDIQLPADNSGNGYVVPGSSFPIKPLDDHEIGEIDFMKIDVEGGELAVVKGAEKTIRACRPVMVVEQKVGHGARFGHSDTAAVELLQSWGARVAWVRSGDYCLVWR